MATMATDSPRASVQDSPSNASQVTMARIGRYSPRQSMPTRRNASIARLRWNLATRTMPTLHATLYSTLSHSLQRTPLHVSYHSRDAFGSRIATRARSFSAARAHAKHAGAHHARVVSTISTACARSVNVVYVYVVDKTRVTSRSPRARRRLRRRDAGGRARTRYTYPL